MLGILLASLITLGLAGLLGRVVRRFYPDLSEAETLGIGGLVGLTLLGWLVFFVFPPRLAWVPALVSVPGLFLVPWRKPERLGPWSLAWVVILLIGLISVLSSPNTLEWDTLAYHFAVPALWLKSNATHYIPFIHHSNFPFAIDSLFMMGLSVGMESLARSFTVLIPVLGAVTMSGLLHRRGQGSAGSWVVLLIGTMPVMLSQLGTGYIDLSHGVYFGLGAAYGLISLSEDKPYWLISGFLIGGAMASKTTGMLAGVGLVAVLVVLALSKRAPRGAVRGVGLAGLIALAISGGWFIRNVKNTGNPVYPFFYSVFGGKGWDKWRADTYAHEQKTFGVGVTDGKMNWSQAGHAVLGLGYQPGRYINPDPRSGTGFPFGAVGAAWVVALAGLFAWSRRNRFVLCGAIFVGIQFAAWIALSQQARYLGGVYVLVAILVADLLNSRAAQAQVLKGVIAIQALYTVYLQYNLITMSQLAGLRGAPGDYQQQTTSFAKVAGIVDQQVGSGRVALYDEVFGYLLKSDYVWANPGHSMLITKDSATTLPEFLANLKSERITHVYLNMAYQTPEFRTRWLAVLSGTESFDQAERAALAADPNLAWKLLISDAVRAGDLRPVQADTRNAILFSVEPP